MKDEKQLNKNNKEITDSENTAPGGNETKQSDNNNKNISHIPTVTNLITGGNHLNNNTKKNKHKKIYLSWKSATTIATILILILCAVLGTTIKENRSLKYDIEELQANQIELESDLVCYEISSENYKEECQNLSIQLKELQNQQAKIDNLNKQLAEYQSKYAALETENNNLKSQPKTGSSSSGGGVLIGSGSFYDSTIDTGSSTGATVHITDTGGKYHNAGCRYLRESDTAVSLDEAQARGLTPCKVCH